MGATTSVETAPAMKPATTVEPAPAAEPFTTVKSSAAVETLVAAEFTAAMPPSLAAEPVPTAKSVPIAESLMVPAPATAVEAVPPTVVAAAVEPVEPRTGPYEHAVIEIIWAIVAIRRARIWRIPIVAIRAHRRRTKVGWPKLNCDLRMGGPSPCHHHKNPGQHSVL